MLTNNPYKIKHMKIPLFSFNLSISSVCQYQMKHIPRILSVGRLFAKFLDREIFLIFFFYAAPLLLQVDAVKEQVKAKCSVFDNKVFSLDYRGLECAWF